MRYLSSLISTAIVLSVLGHSPAFGQAGSTNPDAPRLDPRGISSVSIPPLGSNYIELGEVRNTRTQFFVTFQVILVNNGPALPGVTASLTSLVPTVQLVPGQSAVHFAPVPANSNVLSNDSFTILIDRSVPFDFSSLQWSFSNPVANPGPNQTATIGSTVTLNGSGSTNPSGIGSLTYKWSLVSVPTGSTAVLTNPNAMVATFQVDLAGTYTAQLTVSNGTASDSATVVISTVSTPPVANAGPNQAVTLGTTVRLDGSKSSDTDGNPLTYSWTLISIPATSTATLSNSRSVNPTFVADVPGSYIAQLVVNDGNSSSLPSTVMVTTANTAPVANAGPNQRVSVGSLVQLNGSGSTDVNGNPLTYQWSLNTTGAPGSKAVLSSANIVNPTFTVDAAGTYVAQLIVSDGILSSPAATVTITTNTTQPPVANAGNNQTVVHGSTVMLNGTGSTDPQGLPLTYMWSLITKPPKSNAVLSASTVPEPQFTADQPGTYVAQLVVSDGVLFSAPATVTITTTNTAPVANAGPNQAVMAGATVTLDGSGSFDADNDPITYSWSFLNRPGTSNAVLTGPTTKNPTFVADAAGTYIVQLIVSDPFTSSNPSTVTITAGLMTISLSPSPLNLVNSPVPLTITLSPAAGANPVVVGLSGFDPNVISIPSPTVTIPANSSGVNVQVTPLAAGSTQILANAGGYQPANDLVNVSTATISVALNNGATAIGLTRTLSGTITLSSPAPQTGLSVTLSADPSAIGQVSFNPASVSIPAGGVTGTFSITGVAVGSTTITASASGYTGGSDSILVVSLGGIAVTQGVTVPPGQSTALGVQLSTPAPVGGVTVTLTSSNINQLTVSPSVFIAQGTTTPATPAQVNGIAIGSPTVTASAGGYSPDTETVKVIATLSLSPSTLSVSPNGTQSLNILLSSPAPGGGLPVTLTSSNPAAATVPPSITINGTSGSVQITGVAPGQTTITASTTNSLFAVVGTGVVVTVTTGPVLTCPAVSSGEVGVALNSLAPVVSGGTAPYTFSVVGTLPGGLTLNTSTGAITGTPTASGTFSLQVKDASGVASPTTCPFTIAAALTLTCPAVNSGAVGVPLNSPAPVVNGGTAPYTFSVTGTLPNGLTLNTSTGSITGTPTVAGTFTLQVKDANGATSAPGCPFTIGSVPVLTCPAVSSGEVGVPLNSPAPVIGGGTAPYTFSVTGTLPGGLTLNTSTGAITGTPTATGTFTLQVKDANGASAAATCPFTIVGPPTLTCPAVSSGEVGAALNSPASVVGGGTAPYTFSVTGTLPGGLTLNTSTGAITGTPTASGTFTLQVKDANGVMATATCPFTIAPPPTLTCPVINSGAVGVPLNSPAPVVNGGLAPYTFSVNGSLPNGLTLNTSTGAMTGTPTVSGGFTLQVKDANGVTAATMCPFTIGTVPVLTCPAVTSGEVGVPLNSPAPVVSGGTAPYTFSVTGTLPGGLTLNTSTGAITGTPTAAGTFTLQVKDANGASAAATCPFTIVLPPTLTCPAVTSGEVGAALNSPAPVVGGGTAPYTFSVTGTLPGGLTLNTSTGAISGTPTTSGTFTLQVKDASGVTAAATCPFTIVLPPTLTCPAVNSGTVGVALNSPAPVVSGGTAPYTFSVTGTLPNGLTLNTSTGAITGTPTVVGTFTLQLKDANGVTAATLCPFTIGATLTLTCPAVSSGEVGVALNSPAPVVSGGTAPYTFSVTGTLPGGLTLNTSTGAITGTPTAGGTFTLQVKDSSGATATTTCPFTIVLPPTLTCPAVSSGEVGVPLNSPAPVVSGGVSPYTFSVTGTLPGGLTLNTSTGAITGTPTAAGTFTLQVRDANGASAAATCPFTIAPPPTLTCPTVSSGEVSVALNSPAPVVSGGTAPYTFSVTGTLPGGLTLNTSTGAISGTPTAAGNFTLQVKDANGVAATAMCPFTIVAGPVLTCPVNNTFTMGVAVNSPAMAVSGGTPSYIFSVVGTLPSGLTFSAATGAISGTPTVNGTFTVQVKDANGVAAATTCPFTVGPNTLTIMTTSLPSGMQNVPYSFQPQISGGTPPFTWAFSSLPRGINGNPSTGLISGTTGFAGTYNVTIAVTDSSSTPQGAATTLPLLIATVPLAFTTPATLPSAPIGMPYSVQITATGGVLPYNWLVNTTDPTFPTWLTFDLMGKGVSNGGCDTPVTLCGTPPTLGDFTFKVTLIDSGTSSLTQTFTGTVTPLTGLGNIALSNATVGQGLQVPINITFTPVVASGATMCPDGPTDPGCMTVTTNNPSLIMLKGPGNSSVTSFTFPVPSGTADLEILVQAVSTAPAGTTATISASLPGYATAIATITYANSGIVVSGPNGIGASFSTFQGVQTTLTVFAAQLDSNGLFVEQEQVISSTNLSVPIASSSPSIGAVSPGLVSISGGTSSATVNFAASGTNSGATSVMITQPAGFTTPTVGGTLNVTVQPSQLIAPSGLVVGKNLQVSTNVSINGNASQAVAVTLQSLDSTRLLFACPPQGNTPLCTPANGASSSSITVTIPQNSSQSASFFVRAYDSAGSIGYTISAPGLGMLPATIPLAPSGFAIQTPGGGFGNFSMPNHIAATLNVFTAAFPSSGMVLEAVAGDQSVSATVTSGTPSVGTIGTSPVVIGGGASSGTTTFNALSVGSANITASATGYTPATVTATVQSSSLSINNFLTVGQHLEANGSVNLSSAAPAGGLPVTLSVAAASVGKLQLAVNPTDAGSNTITVTVPQGQFNASYWVYALASSGTATYTATAPGYVSGPPDTVSFAPSAIILVGGGLGGESVSSSAGPQTLTVITNVLTADGQNTPQSGSAQPLAGNVPLTVMLANSNGAAGTLSAASVNIAPGATSNTVTFTPKATGNATISITEPAGWTTPGPLVTFQGSFDLTRFVFQVQ
jgi:Putative Ig domain/PKD domain